LRCIEIKQKLVQIEFPIESGDELTLLFGAVSREIAEDMDEFGLGCDGG
jgi:hypothetical protein